MLKSWNDCISHVVPSFLTPLPLPACREGTFGANCSSVCACNVTNTLTCDKVKGSCTCHTGWSGPTCNKDVNECQNTSTCLDVANSTCQNTPGSYVCACNTGYYTSADQCYGIGFTLIANVQTPL